MKHENLAEEINICIGLLGTLFVFLSLTMNLPSDPELLNQTKTFYLSYYYSITLDRAIESFLLMSFFLLSISIFLYIIQLVYGYMNEDSYCYADAGLLFLITGFFFWAELFFCYIIVYILKFFGYEALMEIGTAYMFVVLGGNFILNTIILDKFLPFQNGYIIDTKYIRTSPNRFLSLVHAWFWVSIWLTYMKESYKSYTIYTPLIIQFGSVFWFWFITLLAIIIASVLNGPILKNLLRRDILEKLSQKLKKMNHKRLVWTFIWCARMP